MARAPHEQQGLPRCRASRTGQTVAAGTAGAPRPAGPLGANRPHVAPPPVRTPPRPKLRTRPASHLCGLYDLSCTCSSPCPRRDPVAPLSRRVVSDAQSSSCSFVPPGAPPFQSLSLLPLRSRGLPHRCWTSRHCVQRLQVGMPTLRGLGSGPSLVSLSLAMPAGDGAAVPAIPHPRGPTSYRYRTS
jgi:hypothetical protein